MNTSTLAGKGRLIGISGLKGSGKDTVAKIISHRINSVEGYLCGVTHYADSLKKAAAALFDVEPEWFYRQDLKERTIPGLCIDITARKIMTDIHDGLVPLFGDRLFVHPVQAQWARWGQARGAFIVADVRYDGRETDWIREAGGVIINVTRPGIAGSSHSSEKGIAPHRDDYLLYNDGGMADLERKVISIVATLRGHVI